MDEQEKDRQNAEFVAKYLLRKAMGNIDESRASSSFQSFGESFSDAQSRIDGIMLALKDQHSYEREQVRIASDAILKVMRHPSTCSTWN